MRVHGSNGNLMTWHRQVGRHCNIGNMGFVDVKQYQCVYSAQTIACGEEGLRKKSDNGGFCLKNSYGNLF